MKPTPPSSLDLLDELLVAARRAGADAADAIVIDSTSLSVGCRLGSIETLERAETVDLGLRVFVGKRQAIVSTTDRRAPTLVELVARAVAMARLAPEDEYCGLAAPEAIAKTVPVLDVCDPTEMEVTRMIDVVRTTEDAARAVEGVRNSEGANMDAARLTISLAASNGFASSYQRTNFSLSASVLAGDGTGMERDYDYATRVFLQDMPTAESIGRRAGERAVKRLGARKMPSMKAPVVFDTRVSSGLISALSGALSGAAVARGTSFLKDKLGQKIFPENITIIDDPQRARGLRTRPFDAEGLLPQKRSIIDRGILTTWLLDTRSARQLNMRSTGHAVRSASGLPAPAASNFFMEAGGYSPAELILDIKHGLYVTDLMGMGVNAVTGDYSQAAAGFWIENGEITFPVNEMTIAGNLKDMFLNLAAANDLEFARGIDAPTVRIEGMMIAGM